MEASAWHEATREGVLLYYRYQDLSREGCRENLKLWYEEGCESLGLRGRIRIAEDGINVTVGGTWWSCQRHIEAVERCEWLEDGIDFKLEEAILAGCDERILRETGFDVLSVRITKELVTLGPRATTASVDSTGEHLTPEAFHRVLEEFESDRKEGRSSDLVLIDARNEYESCIGRFEADGLTCLTPEVRSFVQFPEWLEENLEKVRDKKILMYCTGGVRCERASAFLKQKGIGFKDVKQLSGGIVRYLQMYGEGGYFKGKNFVFDPRIAVPAGQCAVIGKCISCGDGYDDYSTRTRCGFCRILVLVCEKCRSSGSILRCKSCIREKVPTTISPVNHLRPLRILVLHGFRQTASNMRGRMGAMRKQLRDIAEFVFLNAPHTLPHYYLRDRPQQEPGLPRRAWLVAADQLGASTDDWSEVPWGYDPQQYTKQTAGWQQTEDEIFRALRDQGPFDGIMGFSQGAMVASVIAFMLCEASTSDEVKTRHPPLQFGIFCSGYPSCLPAHIDLYKSKSPLGCPSLHLFGSTGHDRQIGSNVSEDLANLFSSKERMMVRHGSGHLIPTNKLYREQYIRFLSQFTSRSS